MAEASTHAGDRGWARTELVFVPETVPVYLPPYQLGHTTCRESQGDSQEEVELALHSGNHTESGTQLVLSSWGPRWTCE